MPAFCSAINCVNKRGKNVGNNIYFFRFPKDQNKYIINKQIKIIKELVYPNFKETYKTLSNLKYLEI